MEYYLRPLLATFAFSFKYRPFLWVVFAFLTILACSYTYTPIIQIICTFWAWQFNAFAGAIMTYLASFATGGGVVTDLIAVRTWSTRNLGASSSAIVTFCTRVAIALFVLACWVAEFPGATVFATGCIIVLPKPPVVFALYQDIWYIVSSIPCWCLLTLL